MKKMTMKGMICISVVALLLMPSNMAANKKMDKESVRLQTVVGDSGLTIPSNEKEFSSLKTNSLSLDENLAPNPSFEEGGDMPTGWTYYDWKDGSTISWDSNYSHSGEKSIGVSDIKKLYNVYGWYTEEFIPVDFIENVYECSVWYKYIGEPAEGQRGCFSLWLYDVNKESTHYAWGRGMPFSTEWNYYRFDTNSFHDETLKEKTKYIKICLYQESRSEINPWVEVRFDDVFFGIRESKMLVKEISGGFGISAVIKNIGMENASNVEWSIDLSGTVFMGTYTEGIITSLPAESEKSIHGFVFGIGPAKITVIAEGAYKTADCFLLGPLVLGIT